MVKGEYDFAILVTCLLILALQIHNPFQSSRQSPCVESGSPALGQVRESSSPPLSPQQQQQQAQQRRAAAQAAEPARPETRRPREAVSQGVAKPGGLSTDDLLRELDSIQSKAKEQQETLSAAGRMPPASPILEQLREVEGSPTSNRGGPMAGRAVPEAMPATAYPSNAGQPMAQAPPSSTFGASAAQASMGGGGVVATPPADAPLLRSRTDFGRFLESRQPRGLGVVLGVGRGDFALRLLADWGSSQGLYLVDPFIHIWRGYDDPNNLSDRDHQVLFEELRNRLAPFEGRHMLVRDFSHSFAEVYQRGGQTAGPPSFVYVDANHAEQAVSRDLELWWPLLQSGGILAGSTYTDDNDGRIRVRASVDRFAAGIGAKVYLTHDDMPPSWFIFKS